MSVSPSQLHDHLGYWLRKLSNHVSQSFAERLVKYEVSVAQWVVLRVLYEHESLPLKDIVAQVGVDQGALSRMIERMVVRGLVTRTTNPDSRREVAIALTKDGRRLVPKLAREADENDETFFGQLPPNQRRTVLSAIQKLLAMHPDGSRGLPVD